MRNAFAEFCDALFNEELRPATLEKLQAAGLLPTSTAPPGSREDRVDLIKRLGFGALLELIYRFQFLSSARDIETVRSYVDNAPLRDQFVYEFLQNAQDAGATAARFEFHDDHVVVANNGAPFSPENFYSICSFRESNLQANHQHGRRIGKFGVGFKSVFRICKEPRILNWGEGWPEPVSFRLFVPGKVNEQYHKKLEPFRFSPMVPENDRPLFHRRVGYLFPVPEPLQDEQRRKWFAQARGDFAQGALFVLLFQRKLSSDDEEHLIARVEPESFLFIQLDRLEVQDLRNGQHRSRVWEKHAERLTDAGSVELLEVCETLNKKVCLEAQQALRYASGALEVPVDELEIDDKLIRDSLPQEARITLVAPMTGGEIAEPELDGDRTLCRLFNGLPVSSAHTGLNFHVDAPFNLDVERMDILEDEFNKWLILQVGVVGGRLLRELRQDARLRDQLHRLVPRDNSYGRGRRAGEVTERLLRPVHDHLEKVAREIGVLPALDQGEPLRAEEALRLTDADAFPRVARALQAVLGGQPGDLFWGLGTDWRANRVRLCAPPQGTHFCKLAEKWSVVPVAPRWVETVLANPERVRALEQRHWRWYRYLFVYVAHGCLEVSLGKIPALTWVPSVFSQRGHLAPQEATLLPGATVEELQRIECAPDDGPGGKRTGGRRLFAHSDFTKCFLDFQKSLEAGGGARQRLKTLGFTVLTWRTLLDETLDTLKQADRVARGPVRPTTPLPVLQLLDLARQKRVLRPEETAPLSSLIRVSIVLPVGGHPAAIWPVADLLLQPDASLTPVPKPIADLLPQPAPDLPAVFLPLLECIVPAIPSPALLQFLLDRIQAPTGDTAAWVARVWKHWQRDLKGKYPEGWSAGLRALGSLHLPGKHGGTFHPLSFYFPEGFGKKFRDWEKNLTVLFGPRAPHLADYGTRFTTQDFNQIRRTLPGPDFFVPNAAQVAQAVARLTTQGDDAVRADLAADLAGYMVAVLDYPIPTGERHDISRVLRGQAWIPLARPRGWAKTDQVFLPADRELTDFLADVIPLPTAPLAKDRRDRFFKVLRELQQAEAVAFAKPAELTPDQRLTITGFLQRRLSTPAAGNNFPDARKQVTQVLQLIGRLLDDGWLDATAAESLWQAIDLRPFLPDGRPVPFAIWVLCATENQAKKLQGQFPRAVFALAEKSPEVRKTLVLAAGGFLWPTDEHRDGEFEVADLLDNSQFAQRYLRNLGKVSGPLSEREQTNVTCVYRTLARDSSSGDWKIKLDEPVVLTAAATLVAAMPPVYSGVDSEVRRLLTQLAPARCLASPVVALAELERTRVVQRLGLSSLAHQGIGEWLRTDWVPVGSQQACQFNALDREHVPAAISVLCRDDVGGGSAVSFRGCPVQLVEGIEKRVQLPPIGPAPVQRVNRWLRSAPQMLFLTPKGFQDLELEILRLRDKQKAAEEEKKRHEFLQREKVFRTVLESHWGEIKELAAKQKADLLSYYRLTISDPDFRRQDYLLQQQQKTVEQRWSAFLSDPLRLKRLVKKHTLDIGYGTETVIRELLQNVDDAYRGVQCSGPAWIQFECQDQQLTVRHAGRRFNQAPESGVTVRDDLLRICSLA